MPVNIFISAVSNEFSDYRQQLYRDLTRQNVGIKIQEDFKNHGLVTLDKLDIYINSCDAVVHLVGNMTGFKTKSTSATAITSKYPDIFERFPALLDAVRRGEVSYTHWEAWLAIYHARPLIIAKADVTAPRGPEYRPTASSIAIQESHLKNLRGTGHYEESTFTSCDNLAKEIAYSSILDILVENKRNLKLAPLAHALVDIATMAFVDVMRLTCVAANETARHVDYSRYPEFIDVSIQHFSEFESQLNRIKDYLSLELLNKCQEIISGLSDVNAKFKRGPILAERWREFIERLKSLAKRIDGIAKLLDLDYYNKRSEIVRLVAPRVVGLDNPNTFILRRFQIQTAVLDKISKESGSTQKGIYYDYDKRLAIPYFFVDLTLLQATLG